MSGKDVDADHLMTRTYGDQVIQRSMRAKCRVLAQLRDGQNVLQTMCWRRVSCPHVGYIASPGVVRMIWTYGLRLLQQPFQVNTETLDAAVMRAPDVAFPPEFY
ncbi:MAG: hypothetical protein CMJ59_14995 [Planctomycetaceae bacterium]|nr:hypothetical protein [Planctomycetaceae bacterium]